MDTVPATGVPPQAPIPPPASVIFVKRSICPHCHQPVLPEYYFCPNCGEKLEDVPLSTSIWAQIKLYSFTFIWMPLTAYLVYTKWKGYKYFKSEDPKAQRIGTVAMVLLAISIIIFVWTTWASIVWLLQYIKAQETNVNSLGGYGSILGE